MNSVGTWLSVQRIFRNLILLAFLLSLAIDGQAAGRQKSAADEDLVAAETAPSTDTKQLVDAALMAKLRQGFQNLCPDCRIEFKDVKIPPFAVEDIKDLKINFQNLKWASSFILPVEFLNETQANINGQVRFYKKGLQAGRAINALESIALGDVSEDWVDVTFLKDLPAQRSDLEGAVARRFLPIRQPLMKSDLRLPQLVSRGQMIKVVTGTELFEISNQMKAEENGSRGDVIRVKNDLNTVLTVKVTGPGTARLE